MYDKAENTNVKLLEAEPAVDAILRKYQTTLMDFDRSILFERGYTLHNFSEDPKLSPDASKFCDPEDAKCLE